MFDKDGSYIGIFDCETGLLIKHIHDKEQEHLKQETEIININQLKLEL